MLLVAFLVATAAAGFPATLPPHPRLVLNATDIERIHTNVKQHPLARHQLKRLLAHADANVAKTPSMNDRGSIMDPPYVLGLAYRLPKDAKYGPRARRR